MQMRANGGYKVSLFVSGIVEGLPEESRARPG